jgi:hypothetical protein
MKEQSMSDEKTMGEVIQIDELASGTILASWSGERSKRR